MSKRKIIIEVCGDEWRLFTAEEAGSHRSPFRKYVVADRKWWAQVKALMRKRDQYASAVDRQLGRFFEEDQ